jgi:hypothetical protein
MFHALRCLLRGRTVNLVYRHLATIPGALPWVVSVVFELRERQLIDRAAEELDAVPVPVALQPSPSLWGTLNIPEGAREEAREVLDVYNDLNPRNLFVLYALVQATNASSSSASDEPSPISSVLEVCNAMTPPSGPALPPTPDPAQLPGPVSALSSEVCTLLGLDRSLAPSLHRHLGMQPTLYGALVLATQQDLHAGSVRESAVDLQQRASLLCQEIASLDVVPPSKEVKAGITDTSNLFRDAIATHCVLGRMWRTVLGESA